MDALRKFLKRLTKKDKVRILEVLKEIHDPEKRKKLDIKKLAGSDLCRVRTGGYRIIFHLEGAGVVIDAVRARNEKTYKF